MTAGDKDELPDAKTAEGRQSEEQELAERSHRGRERLGMALRGDGGDGRDDACATRGGTRRE
jgi:hypothetical protein